MTKHPQFSVLGPAECADVLQRTHVGRLAFMNHDAVDIEPLGYVAEGDWLFMRSAHGAKLHALAHTPYVAFEVDEIKGPLDWRSVVVHGTVYMLPTDGAPIERRQAERAIAALRTVMPHALTKDDPVPERRTVYGLHIDRIEGRMARSGATKTTSKRAAATNAARKRRR